jgi:hypothetical protein
MSKRKSKEMKKSMIESLLLFLDHNNFTFNKWNEELRKAIRIRKLWTNMDLNCKICILNFLPIENLFNAWKTTRELHMLQSNPLVWSYAFKHNSKLIIKAVNALGKRKSDILFKEIKSLTLGQSMQIY